MMRRSLLAALFLVSCSDDGTPPPAENPDANVEPPTNGQDLVTDEFTLAPGEEKFSCYTFRSPDDGQRGIIEIQSTQGQVVHHVVLFQTLAPEPDGFQECNELIRQTWQPIWAAGAGGAGIVLPEGTAFIVEPDTQYLVQYHLQNVGEAPVTETATVHLTYAEDSSTLTPAGLFALGAFSLEIPGNAMDFQQVIECQANRDMTVFAVFPHMHKLGTRISFEHGDDAATAQTAYSLDPWVFGDQPMDPIDLTIETGDFIRATCTWDNPSPDPVTFGESSDNEMCFFVLFYYPFTGLGGCID